MKKVYIITSLCDYEYGCREIESVWNSLESAESHLEELGGRQRFAMWDGRILYEYDIEEWTVQE